MICTVLGVLPCEGRPRGAPLPIVFFFRPRNRPPVAKDVWNLRWRTTICTVPGVMPCEGRPQGAPLPIVFSRRFALRRAPTRGAPTDCLLSAFCPAKGAHKGRPYRLSSLGVLPWEGHPQGVPLPIVLSRRYALRRAPTRGAPTRFRQPHEVFSNLMQLPCRRPAYVTY